MAIPVQPRLFPTYPYKMPIQSMQYAQTGRAFVELTEESFQALEDMMKWCQNVGRNKLPHAEDIMTMMMAMLAGGIAQKYSAGMKRHPDDSSRAWKMPVPRITERYFLGWRVKRLRRGTWMLTNLSREAYYIEYGIHRNPVTKQVSPRRIRRPVFKLTLKETMKMLHKTAIAHRVWSDILIPKSGEPGRRTKLVTWSQPSGRMGIQPIIIGHVAGQGLLQSGAQHVAHSNYSRATFKSIARNRRKRL